MIYQMLTQRTHEMRGGGGGYDLNPRLDQTSLILLIIQRLGDLRNLTDFDLLKDHNLYNS